MQGPHPRVLLIGPFDPLSRWYSFMSPPLGLWRIAGFLRSRGIGCRVLDLNLSSCPYTDLAKLLAGSEFSIIGFSLTHTTLPYDLSLIHQAKTISPRSILVIGGVEATFNYRLIMSLAPIDMAVIGEGEIPLLNLCEALQRGGPLEGIAGTVMRNRDGLTVVRGEPLSFSEFRESGLSLPLEEIPFRDYWNRLMHLYRGDGREVPNEEDLQRINSVNLMTLNHCPFRCAFCSYTNFLDSSSGGKPARVHRLPPDDVLQLLKKISTLLPETRTVIFRDDIFVFKNDRRIKPLCECIASAVAKGAIDRGTRFICSCRADSGMTEPLVAMKKAGFALIGYGIESFSKAVLQEFNKGSIFDTIEPVLNGTIEAGITPFLNIILSSPRSTLEDILTTLVKVFEYQSKGCETSMYPYVIPFAGSDIAKREDLKPYTRYEEVKIPFTDKAFRRAVKIVPIDSQARDFMEELETNILVDTEQLTRDFMMKHFPSRIRALITVYSAAKILEKRRVALPFSTKEVVALLKELGISH